VTHLRNGCGGRREDE